MVIVAYIVFGLSLIHIFLEVGKGERPASDMKRILESKDREQAGPTAAAQGLFLLEVEY